MEPEPTPPQVHRTSRHTWSVLLLVVALAALGYFGYKSVETRILGLTSELEYTKAQVIETQELLSLVAEGNQDLRVQLKAEEFKREETTEALEEIAQERQELASQLIDLETELTNQRETLTPVDVTKVVREWSNRVARVECSFTLSGGRRARSVGSAVATLKDGKIEFVTNEHVITGQTDLVPKSCTMRFPGLGNEVEIEGTSAVLEPDRDLARLSTNKSSIAGVTTPLRECSQDPSIGDELIILGYPSVGSPESVTATEGIISGFDNGLYVTSAKIERGNSGGAAIHIKNNCFLGIPTLVVVGEIESLARILPL